MVCELNEDTDVLADLRVFLNDVENFKKSYKNPKLVIKNTASKARSRTKGDSNAGFFEEFSGRVKFTVGSQRDYFTSHGLVVSALRDKLNFDGFNTFKDGHRDLWAEKNNKKSYLFEVKTDSTRGSVYQAIGQLLVYETGLKGIQKVLVIPRKKRSRSALPNDIKTALALQKIDVLFYQANDPVTKESIVFKTWPFSDV